MLTENSTMYECMYECMYVGVVVNQLGINKNKVFKNEVYNTGYIFTGSHPSKY